MGCFVKSKNWIGYGQQKRFGEDFHNKLIGIKLQRICTANIKDEIIRLFETKILFSFYAFKVVPIYHNWKKPRLLSSYHNCVRLYDKSVGRFSNSAVHDSVLTGNNEIKLLKHPVLHNSVRSYSHLIAKQNSYIRLQVETLKKRNIGFGSKL